MCQQYNLTPFSSSPPPPPAAANENDERDFDPADWLRRWRDAGGGWTTSIIFRPRRHADDNALDRLCGELDDEKRRTLFDHLKETTI